MVSDEVLVRNSLRNFVGLLVPLLVAFLVIPFVIHQLGAERFAILSLAWVVLGYFSYFDMGLGAATTRFVAEAIGAGNKERIPAIIITSTMLVAALGAGVGVLLIVVTPFLVSAVLKIPLSLIEETRLVFSLTALSIPVSLLRASFSGVLEAHQRFDLINQVRIPSETLTWLIPAGALLIGFDLPTIIALLTIRNVVVLFGYIVQCRGVVERPLNLSAFNIGLFPSLFEFGGWIALHNAAVAVLLYLDQFLVAAFLDLRAVAHYTVPYTLISRALIVPSAVMMVLFPAFGSMAVADERALWALFGRAWKYLAVIMGLIVGVVVVFAQEILLYWVGGSYQESSVSVLRILAIGVLFSSIAWLSGSLLQGVGRPRTVTLIHVAQVPAHVGLTWLLISVAGIEGAAFSWTMRVVLSTVLLLMACARVGAFKLSPMLGGWLARLFLILILVGGVAAFGKTHVPMPVTGLVLMVLAYGVAVLGLTWRYVLDHEDRSLFRRCIRGMRFAALT